MRCAGLEAFGLFGSDVKYYWDFYYMSVHTAGRIENNEKMSCDCAALRSAFDLLFSSSPTCLSHFCFVVLPRVSGAFVQPRL